jgi:hypothetical protein
VQYQFGHHHAGDESNQLSPLPLLLSNRKSPDISNFPPRQFVIKFHEPKNKNTNGGLSGKEKKVAPPIFVNL